MLRGLESSFSVLVSVCVEAVSGGRRLGWNVLVYIRCIVYDYTSLFFECDLLSGLFAFECSRDEIEGR